MMDDWFEKKKEFDEVLILERDWERVKEMMTFLPTDDQREVQLFAFLDRNVSM
jgi:hypothetical protein